MKSVIWILSLILLIGTGAFFAFKDLSKEKQHTVNETQLMLEGLKQVSKLQVTEAQFTEVINYKDVKSYAYDYLQFEKKALVVVNAKAKISYDLRKLTYELDSINKNITITNIPDPEVDIIPDIKYYDLQQSSYNQFKAKDYNDIYDKAVISLKKNKIVDDLKVQAEDRLVDELNNLFFMTKVFGWKLKNKSNNQDVMFERPIELEL